ncbi:WecB/TagA/CpsF family glycosyltransferase [Caldimonas brevitalea]|uniref:N-acetylmannosaminyltransferase n=1 Tax=Caldimonas brevitalea TaxID=413882 RepID=A0A0G3BWY4_9BURK|nr:WecB/TagA/CpsF family glycosyltransferase [Caldimonas brevitalea]AKJ31876.1 N-acetylmannosaminyltransferase [Caldimonas brevitalea]
MRAIQIGSLRLEVGNADESVELVRQRLSGRPSRTACFGFLNPHVYNVSASDPHVAAFLERCEAVCLDGVGAALAASVLNRTRLPRVVMHQVFDACLDAGCLRGRVVLLGLTPDEYRPAADHLARAAPLAEFVACHHGFLGDEDYAAIFREHRDADLILVGMGTPRSERVLSLAADICDHALCWHVGGGSLRHWAGTKRRAPAVVSRLGLEWLHRMAYEPETRSRYTTGAASFLRHLTIDSLHARRGGHPR